MDIEEFYDGDERRRTSDELQFGQDWHDAHGRRYELNWIEDTGELYVMRDDPPPIWSDPFGDLVAVPADSDNLGVRVLKLVHGRDQVLELLAGWDQAMGQGDSIAWLIDRLRNTRTT
ncbi:MAG TPA: hypothetical protein VHH09_05625 [Acidimicrobiales bacterium]|nr:hypothetical protein [Acidimicrobiales bacterium]